MSASAHYDAMFARLNGFGLLMGKGYRSVRRSTGGDAVRDNYWVLRFAAPTELDDDRYLALQRVDSKARVRYDYRAVGTTEEWVSKAIDLAMGALVGHVLTVPGRVCDPVTVVPEVDGGDLLFDATTNLFYLDITFQYVSRPA